MFRLRFVPDNTKIQFMRGRFLGLLVSAVLSTASVILFFYPGLNYGIDKVRFLAPVPAGARVRLRVVLAGLEPKDAGQVIMKTQNTLEVEGSEKPALVAETLALLIPATGAR